MLWPEPILLASRSVAVHKDGDHDAGDEAEGEDGFLHARLLLRVRIE
jgi:hypothetical protein